MPGQQPQQRGPQQASQGRRNGIGLTIEELRRQAEAKGRELFEAAIRTGRPLLAKTTADLIEVGARALMADPRVALIKAASKPAAVIASNPQVQRKAEDFHRFVQGPGFATGNGAVDAFTFGGA